MTTDVASLFESYQATRDPKLRERLILSHVPFVRYVASQMLPKLHQSVEYQDLVSYGMFGLIDAVERYDLKAGTKFSTFAMYRIRGSIGDGIRAQAWEPRSVRSRHRAVAAATAELEHELGRAPTEDEVATRVGIATREVRQAQHDMRSAYVDSINRQVIGGEEEVAATIADHDSELATPMAELGERMGTAIAELPEQERLLLEWVYVQGKPFKDIASVLGVHDSLVSHLHTKALVSVQRAMAGQY